MSDQMKMLPVIGVAEGHQEKQIQTKPSIGSAQKIGNEIYLTVISNDCKQPLSKSFSMSSNGKIESKIAAQLTQGTYEQIGVNSLRELGAKLDSLKVHECVMFGIPKCERGTILSRAKYSSIDNRSPETVTRSKEHFAYSHDRAIMVLDIDKRPGVDMPDVDSMIATIQSAIPELGCIDLLAGASTSSNIVSESTGEELKGVSGFHIQLIVSNGLDIPKIGAWIEDRLWLVGHGWILVTDKGGMLEKTLVDRSVWQASKLIFSSAECGAGLVQKKAPRVVFDGLVGGDLSLGQLSEITEAEQKLINDKKTVARKNALSESTKKKSRLEQTKS